MFLPDHTLRYVWSMLTLLIGGLGAYYLARDFVIRKFTLFGRFWAALAGVFYIFNLSTVQQYYVQFETFTSHFAFLPWIFWGVLLYLTKATLKRLVLLSAIFLLSSPSYYVPTIFVVTALALGIISLAHFLFHRNFNSFKKVLNIFLSLFVTNAFWLLPFAYFTLTNSQVAVENKINQMATQTIYLENKQHGNLLDVPLLKSFWFNKIDPDIDGQFNFLMLPWKTHLENPFILSLGYLLFGVVVFGVVHELKNKNWRNIGFAGILLLSLTLLLSATPPFFWIGEFLRNKITLFNQAFRFPFTKFSIVASLMYSLFFASGLYAISKIIPYKKLRLLCLIGGIGTIFIFTLPAIRGDFFYSKEQIKIPTEYFGTFKFFKQNGKNERIANFPQHTLWGWNFYKWGYGGSGFLWYGIDQPILDRAFDPWSKHNENYYWEISQAIYSKDIKAIESILEKYQISWLLVDENVLSPLSPKSVFTQELKELLVQSSKVTQQRTFGRISVYKVNLESQPHDFIFAVDKLPSVASYDYDSNDIAYSRRGSYKEGAEYIYPFRSLFTGRAPIQGLLKEEGDRFVVQTTVPSDIDLKDMLSQNIEHELVFIDPDTLGEPKYEKPTIEKDVNTLTVSFPKIQGYFSRTLNPTETDALRACDNPDPKKGQHIAVQKSVLQSFSVNNTCRVSFWIPTLSHSLSYLIKVQSRNISGQSHVFWIENPISDRVDQELYLPKSSEFQTSYLIQSPMTFDGIGYTFHFDNRSVGNNRSVNELGAVEVYPFPYKFLKNLFLTNLTEGKSLEYLDVSVSHPNQSLYKVKPDKVGTIVLSQAYDKGWVAYQGGKIIKDHFLVNNWENGWKVDNTGEITIIYAPQLLQYLGFVLLGVGLIVLLFKLWSSRSNFLKKEKKH